MGGFFAGIYQTVVGAILGGWHWLIGLRLPHLAPSRGAAITGLIVGFLAVGLGYGFYQLFSATLGTTAGGRWGFLAVVFVAFVTFLVGELFLAGFGVPHSRAISILSVLLVLLFVLVFFLDLAAGIWALLIVPTLCVLSYMASSTVMQWAGAETNAQRLPWEPTDDESLIN